MSESGGARYVDHIGILVANADESAAQFTGRLGMRKVHDEVVDHVGARLVYLAGSDAHVPGTIQLVQPVSPGPLSDHLLQHGEGPHHVCLAVTDLSETLACMPSDEAGSPFTGRRGRRACFLISQHASTIVELVEVGPAEAEAVA